jgi:hypothetical protein
MRKEVGHAKTTTLQEKVAKLPNVVYLLWRCDPVFGAGGVGMPVAQSGLAPVSWTGS